MPTDPQSWASTCTGRPGLSSAEHRGEVVGEAGHGVRRHRLGRRGQSDPPVVVANDPESLGQQRNDAVPQDVGIGKAVHQHDRRTVGVALFVDRDTDAVRAVDELGVPVVLPTSDLPGPLRPGCVSPKPHDRIVTTSSWFQRGTPPCGKPDVDFEPTDESIEETTDGLLSPDAGTW